MAVTFLGGMLGIILSFGLALVIGTRPFLADLLEDASRQTDIHLLLSSDVLLAATSILIFVSLASGLWPALRAAARPHRIAQVRAKRAFQRPHRVIINGNSLRLTARVMEAVEAAARGTVQSNFVNKVWRRSSVG